MVALACWAAAFAAPAAADATPWQVEAVALHLEAGGYTEVRVTKRVFGGFAVQALDGDRFVMILLSPDGLRVSHAELFEDADADGVFESDEALGLDGTATLRALVAEAVKAGPADAAPDATPRDIAGGDVQDPAHAQKQESLFAPAAVKAYGKENVGAFGIGAEASETLWDTDAEGSQRRGRTTTDTKFMSGFATTERSAWAINKGGPQGDFAPLALSIDQADGAGIRDAVTSAAPNAETLGASLTLGAPNADDLRAAILATTPTADSIRALIPVPGGQ